MKKILLTLTICASLGCINAWPATVPSLVSLAAVSSSSSVKGGVGHIYFSAGSTDATFNVYSITGQLVRVVHVNAGTRAAIEMPKGFYVVRYGSQWSCKVVVK